MVRWRRVGRRRWLGERSCQATQRLRELCERAASDGHAVGTLRGMVRPAVYRATAHGGCERRALLLMQLGIVRLPPTTVERHVRVRDAVLGRGGEREGRASSHLGRREEGRG